MGNKILKNHCNTFRKMINSSKIQKATNHITKLPTKGSNKIIDLIPQGKAYRSDRLWEKSTFYYKFLLFLVLKEF